MADPTVLDVRPGLTQEAIDLIRQARGLQIALADPGAAFLGLWTGDGREQAMLVLLVEQAPVWSNEPGPPLILNLAGPAFGGAAERLSAALRVGDRLTLGLMMPERRVILTAQGPEGFEIKVRMPATAARRWQPTAGVKNSEGDAA